MEEVRYMISDAANLLHVESHVLRYWEEELELEVPRNEMGHRYYTEENIRQFEQIRKLKEEGYQLKAIKMLVHNQNTDAAEKGEVVPKKHKAPQAHGTPSRESGMSKLEQFQILMTRIVREAIAENNHELGKEIGPMGGMTVTADSAGHVKGYPYVPDVVIPANGKGKLDVAGVVGDGIDPKKSAGTLLYSSL